MINMTTYERSNYLRSFLVNSYGRIAEVFHHSLNVQFGNHYLHVGGGEIGLTAFGISLPMDDVLKIIADNDVNNRVIYRDGQILFYGNTKVIKYNLNDFTEVDLKILPKLVNLNSMNSLLKILKLVKIDQKIGLDINYVTDLELTIMDFSQNKSNQLVDKLIGRGKGLTPSGDDMLVGMLMLFSSIKGEEDNYNYLKNSLIKKNLSRTTPVSENYIQAALNGYISEDLKLLSEDLNCNDPNRYKYIINNIFLMGHTSGHDTIMGIYLALMLILGGKNNDKGKIHWN